MLKRVAVINGDGNERYPFGQSLTGSWPITVAQLVHMRVQVGPENLGLTGRDLFLFFRAHSGPLLL
ncbi:hypothetical protein PanWU01x14_225970 [Parasponia andersonii]|uniref:Uncharacterized protein n=1 Tax=Parasponia andersonii TaxID=3476 RepID=A0A2P5BMH9_PARAD|nr:hypothetical protein PanWU01x14_225970 [Parasponia andersonii]